MKILVFGMTENPGGIESVLLNYYTHMDSQKFQMDFLCNTEVVAYEQILKDFGARIFRIPMRSKDRLGYSQAMNAFFSEHGKEYDVIWVNVCSLANIDYLKYAKKSGIPVRIIHAHNSANMDSRLRGLLHQYNRRNLEKYANVFWTCSKEATQWFYNDKIQLNDTIELIHNAIDPAEYAFSRKGREKVRREFGFSPDALVLGNTGRLHFQKNQQFLLDILASLKKTVPEAKLLIVGQGEELENLQKKAQELDIQDSVVFALARSDMQAVLSAMDVFVFPSLFEGAPLALIEAQANGLPCFVYDKKIAPEMEMSDSHWKMREDSSASDWAEMIKKADKTRNLHNNLRIAAGGYDINKEAAKMEGLLEKYDKIFHS